MRFVGPNPLFARMNPSSDWRLSSYFLLVVWLPLAGVAELADALDSKMYFCDFHEIAFRFKTSGILRGK